MADKVLYEPTARELLDAIEKAKKEGRKEIRIRGAYRDGTTPPIPSPHAIPWDFDPSRLRSSLRDFEDFHPPVFHLNIDHRGHRVEEGDIVATIDISKDIIIFEVAAVHEKAIIPLRGSSYEQEHENPRDNDGEVRLVPVEHEEHYSGVSCGSVFLLQKRDGKVLAEPIERELLEAYLKVGV